MRHKEDSMKIFEIFRDKKTVYITSAVLAVLSAAVLIFGGLKGSAPSASADAAPVQPVVTQSDVSPTDPTEWTGWQSAKTVTQVTLTDETGGTVQLEAGTVCAATQRDGDRIFVNSKTVGGWTDISGIELTGELYIADDAQVSQPAALSAEHAAKVESIAKKYKSVGLTLAVIEDGKVAYTYEYGWANKEEKKPMTSDTKIRVASVSKVFTAMNAMAARDLGALSLDGDISDILGYEVRNSHYPKKDITLYTLMTHTSSINNLGSSADIRDALTSRRSFGDREPGSPDAWIYNNFSSGVVGAVTEKALGMTLVNFSQKYFLDPMGIDAAYHAKWIDSKSDIATLYLGSKVCRTVGEQRSRVYHKTPGKNYAPYFGALTISAKDMASVVTVLINDGQYGGRYYLSPESVAEMEKTYLTPGAFDQCLIMRKMSDMYDSRTLYYHTGHAQGVQSFMSYDAESGDGLVVIATGMRSENKDEKGIYGVCGDIADYCYSNIL